jgi:serine/threonine-protein kinase
MDTDRNLLFTVLCLQADLIDAAQLAEICTAWTARKEPPLADLLVESGWITPADQADVYRLLERKIKKHGGAQASLAACADASIRGLLGAVDDEQVRQSLATLPQGEAAALAPTTDYRPETRGRYTLTQLHAQGGIGQVWLAQDQQLGRAVALKELRPEQVGDTAAQSRFFEEAKVTGQLQHPGIVPVYELAWHPESHQPFYTMRFIQGRTLREAVREYHAKGTAGLLDLNSLLNAFVAVCNAVAYAHSRGVLHRDLKPHNVVLDDFGEVVVLDWGLAKVLDRAEPNSDAPPVVVQPGERHEATLQGQVLGTPAYMAPEQAAGRLDLIDRRTDVYGLEAILYEVLTGRAPFGDASTLDVLLKVLEQDPTPPRQVARQVPAALEAVCLKALAKKPQDRYASATELAAEVRRWLADEPVGAWREPRIARLARWGRRHKLAAIGAAVPLLTAVAALAIGTALLGREQRRTEEQRELAVARKHEASEWADLAMGHHRLSQPAQAKAYLGRLQKAIQAAGGPGNQDIKASLHEAEALIQAPAAAKGERSGSPAP